MRKNSGELLKHFTISEHIAIGEKVREELTLGVPRSVVAKKHGLTASAVLKSMEIWKTNIAKPYDEEDLDFTTRKLFLRKQREAAETVNEVDVKDHSDFIKDNSRSAALPKSRRFRKDDLTILKTADFNILCGRVKKMDADNQVIKSMLQKLIETWEVK
ncbi:hypothetical protein KAR91_23700 [Candidatus Pacearchaeota archaeon]|nr:hypothetical protein [Candidatus Pacearchaeota archaeon]